ncbi:MAG: LEA type 2 family protein [Spirochaetales bacterium]|jgi:LEA14-like dessication related protein|nr:LEA type 2 family protein [Spirochaetales bacterium]
MNRITRLLAALLIAGAFAGCVNTQNLFKEPVITPDTPVITGLDFEGADILAAADIYNPNPFVIPIPAIKWVLTLAGQPFLNGEIPPQGTIAAESSARINIPVRAGFEEIYNGINTLLSSTEVDYAVNLDLRFDLPLIKNKSFPLVLEGTLPLPRIPVVSFGSLTLNNLGLTSVEMILALGLENPNGFSLRVDSFDYTLDVNASSWIQGKIDQGYELLPGQERTVTLLIALNSLSTVRELMNIMASRNPVEYSLWGNLEAGSSLPFFGKAVVPFRINGVTRIVR